MSIYGAIDFLLVWFELSRAGVDLSHVLIDE